jgi:hypothetical protein
VIFRSLGVGRIILGSDIEKVKNHTPSSIPLPLRQALFRRGVQKFIMQVKLIVCSILRYKNAIQAYRGPSLLVSYISKLVILY